MKSSGFIAVRLGDSVDDSSVDIMASDDGATLYVEIQNCDGSSSNAVEVPYVNFAHALEFLRRATNGR